MSVPATLEIKSKTRNGDDSPVSHSSYFSEYASPTSVVPPLARFIDWCQVRNEMPAGQSYATYTLENPGDLFNADDQEVPVVDGEILFVYELDAMQVPGGWVGSLTIRCKSLARTPGPKMHRLAGVSFRSDDLLPLHNCAIHYLNRSLAAVQDLNRPELTAEGEQLLREQVLWHTARRETSRAVAS